ncbi:MAG: hypothetical protein WCO42_02080 [bacterium]
MPFGNEAPSVATAARAEAADIPAESFSKTLTLCAITRSHDTGKVQVGLVDHETRKSYFLGEGDKEDGLELKEADYVEEKALLAMGEKEVWLTMKAGAMKTPTGVRNPFGFESATSSPPPSPDESGTMTLAAMSGEAEPAADSFKKLVMSSQMELLRARGAKGPPLPMALTPEMDDQLVKEGVLAQTE